MAQVGKASDPVKPQREAELGRDGAAEPFNQNRDCGRVHFAQEFQGQVDVVNGSPAYTGARIAQRMLELVEQLLQSSGIAMAMKVLTAYPPAGSRNRRRQARAKNAARSRIESRLTGYDPAKMESALTAGEPDID